MRIQELNNEKLAETVLRLALVSQFARHKKISYTLKDYVLPSDDQPEMQFVKDLFVLGTEEIIEKWYGGQDEAISLMMELKKID